MDVVWAFAMLGHVHSTMAKECFKALALVAPEALSEGQLVMLWAAHMRYQQLGHVVLDPNPLLAESYSVFAREVRPWGVVCWGGGGRGDWVACLNMAVCAVYAAAQY